MPTIAEHRSPAALAVELLARHSISPNDAGCQEVLRRRLVKAGFMTEVLNLKRVNNLWACHGTRAPLVVLAGHTDVVPPGPIEDWKHDPFSQKIVEGYLYGRGAADMKGGLASLTIAAENFITKHPDHAGSLAMAVTSDEELSARIGTGHVLRFLEKRGVQIHHALIAEPTSHHSLADEIKVGSKPGALTKALTTAITETVGAETKMSCEGGMSSGLLFQKHGAEIVELGLSKATIHAANECVKVKDLFMLTAIYERTLEILLKVA